MDYSTHSAEEMMNVLQTMIANDDWDEEIFTEVKRRFDALETHETNDHLGENQ